MLLSVLLWAASVLDWKSQGVHARPATTTAARRDDAKIDWGSVRCPVENSLETLPTPTYPSEKGMFLVCTELIINATPQEIYHALFDFRAYPTWSSFVRDIALPPEVVRTPEDVRVGLVTRFTTTGIVPLLNTTSVEIVTVMKGAFGDDDVGEKNTSTSPPYLMATWRYDDELHGTASRSEHPSILVDRGDGTTLYTSYETYFTGPGTLLLLPFKQTLQKQYTQQGLDLKAYVEKAK
ncbi:uncharacterized protein PG998_007239 [Apiospora kogelbergensis]|uniref:Polyketide cyclase / dehydrase and lipid transport n=1 Tax=Apiospora kogelbergensis TaxID=1337665 RepID=A0AAW0QJE2_9PEZI